MGIVIEDDPDQDEQGPESTSTAPVHNHYCPEHGEWSHNEHMDDCGMGYVADCPRDDHKKVGNA